MPKNSFSQITTSRSALNDHETFHNSEKSTSNRRVSRSERAGVLFSVSRIENELRRGRYADRISPTASIYLAGVLQYLVAEVAELSGNAMVERSRRKRLNNRDIFLAIQNDQELSKLCANVTIPESGVQPFIHEALLKPRRSRRLRRVHFSENLIQSSSTNQTKVDFNNNSLTNHRTRSLSSFDEMDED